MREDETRVVADPRRQQSLYALQPGDPDRLGGFWCINRLKTSVEPVNDEKPVPILAAQQAPGSDGSRDLVVLKVLTAAPTSDGEKRLAEEKTWSEQRRSYRGDGGDGRYRWVARDFVQGVSLDQLVERPGWTGQRAATLARLILSEIAAVHQGGEIHCDIKPANVIVHGRTVTLIDFESSRDRLELEPRAIEATKCFASPEQLLPRQDRPIGEQTDLFSWGVTVCHLYRPSFHPYCGGPFDEQAIAGLDRSIRAGATPNPQLDVIAEPGVRAAVRRSLAWQPSVRGDARALLEAMGAAGANTTVLDGATAVLSPARPGPVEPTLPDGLIARYLGPKGLLGRQDLRHTHVAAYAAASFLLSFLLALVLFVGFGLVLT